MRSRASGWPTSSGTARTLVDIPQPPTLSITVRAIAGQPRRRVEFSCPMGKEGSKLRCAAGCSRNLVIVEPAKRCQHLGQDPLVSPRVDRTCPLPERVLAEAMRKHERIGEVVGISPRTSRDPESVGSSVHWPAAPHHPHFKPGRRDSFESFRGRPGASGDVRRNDRGGCQPREARIVE